MPKCQRESTHWLEEYRKLTGTPEAPRIHRAYGRLTRIVQTRVRAAINLGDKCSFPKDVKYIAVMLIAHPDALPMTEKNRAFVQFALKVATTPAADLTPKDFGELAAAGLSREEVQETIGFAAFWVMNTIFNSAALVALSEE